MDTAGQTCVSLNVEQVPVPCSIENRHPYPGACPHDYFQLEALVDASSFIRMRRRQMRAEFLPDIAHPL